MKDHANQRRYPLFVMTLIAKRSYIYIITTQICKHKQIHSSVGSSRCPCKLFRISLSFTFAHRLTFGIRLPLSALVEVPHIRRLIMPETILFLLLTITTCRQTCLACLHYSSGLPVESQSGLLALFECQFRRVVTAVCTLIFDLVSGLLIKMMRIINLVL